MPPLESLSQGGQEGKGKKRCRVLTVWVEKRVIPFFRFCAKSTVLSNDIIDFLHRLQAENDYAHSAQLVKIIYRAKGMKYITTWLKHFLYKHEKYIHPNYIVENKVRIADNSSETKEKNSTCRMSHYSQWKRTMLFSVCLTLRLMC